MKHSRKIERENSPSPAGFPREFALLIAIIVAGILMVAVKMIGLV